MKTINSLERDNEEIKIAPEVIDGLTQKLKSIPLKMEYDPITQQITLSLAASEALVAFIATASSTCAGLMSARDKAIVDLVDQAFNIASNNVLND